MMQLKVGPIKKDALAETLEFTQIKYKKKK